MGLLVVLLAIIIFMYLLLGLVLLLECCTDASTIKSVSTYLKKKLFWSTPLGFFIDAYLEMCVSVFIYLHTVSLPILLKLICCFYRWRTILQGKLLTDT